MAGHSKWANIQHRKGRQDAKRGKLFTKLIREITVAAKLGGGEPNANPRLRAAIDNGLSNNMTKDTIDRAIKRGAGGDDSGNVDEIRYEGYGPGGVALIVDTMTDNKNRTVAEIRHVFSKFGGNLGTDGSVSYLFTKIGLISLQNEVDEDTILELAIECGAQDCISKDNFHEIHTNNSEIYDVKNKLEKKIKNFLSTEIEWLPLNTISLSEKNKQDMIKFLETLDDNEDVQNIFTNARFDS